MGEKDDQLAKDDVPSRQSIDWITKKELSLHCLRTTRISDDITDLISELIKVYYVEHSSISATPSTRLGSKLCSHATSVGSLVRVNQQGKPEMCFDGITQMWYQPPLLDRYFSRPIFLWMPKKLWRVLLYCPDPVCSKKELTSAGLYRTLRKVFGMSGYYYLAAEYLECPRCHNNVIRWSDEILSQLDVGHRIQFPCILTRHGM
ncbi:unnamed protein product [Mytilus edulis]|uniref:DUF6729 domain-containing protein n=1 Tax=Mytilus edulis TaxID=6550 RepID=A0A8S3RWT2_MYTED|nr:unnamed protein product [Mytilus edulis]